MLNLRMFTLFMAEKYAYAWFNLISCHSVQKEIIKKVKKYSWRLSGSVICLVASGSKAAGLRQFLSIDANFIVVARLLQLCMLSYRNLSFMRTVE